MCANWTASSTLVAVVVVEEDMYSILMLPKRIQHPCSIVPADSADD